MPILFDLDGTLLDTAPDFKTALDRLLAEEGHSPIPLNQVEKGVALGSVGCIEIAFGLSREESGFEDLRKRFLDYYSEKCTDKTKLYEGMSDLIGVIEAAGQKWGVVTNKPGYLTKPILQNLHLNNNCSTIVSGDSTDKPKPHPAPLLLACEELKCQPQDCVFIGDNERDILAGMAIKMKTIAALWGYINEQEDVKSWPADAFVDYVDEVLPVLKKWGYV